VGSSRKVRFLVRIVKTDSEADASRVVQDQELNVVLLKLLDYLAHTNPIVSGVAFNEVRVSSPLSIKTNQLILQRY
jgi:hypothetical protein